jgi:TRAP-type C4-dicarboxylate transport system substrate-binding protein
METSMSRFKIVATLIVAVVVLSAPLSAVPVPLAAWKLPTAVPTGSLWHKALTDMTAAWAKDTGGRVTATVFPNSALGSEPSVVRNMRAGQFQGSLLMLSGLALIDEGFNALGIPFFFKDDAETRAVQEALTPLLEKRIDAKGFHLLAWTNGGWVQLYSKKQLKTLDEIKKAKLWTSDGDTRMVQWYKTNGFGPVASDAKDVVPAMRIGTIDATPSPSYVAQVTSLYREAPYMLDIHVGPLLGAIVVTKAAWSATSPEDQAKITAAAKVFETSTSKSVPAQDAASVVEMQKRGLTVTKMADKDSADLYAQIAKLVASMRGDMVPADMYDAAKKALDAYRAKGK